MWQHWTQDTERRQTMARILRDIVVFVFIVSLGIAKLLENDRVRGFESRSGQTNFAICIRTAEQRPVKIFSAISRPEQANVQCDDSAVGFVLDQKA
jgi:hypothetical protein